MCRLNPLSEAGIGVTELGALPICAEFTRRSWWYQVIVTINTVLRQGVWEHLGAALEAAQGQLDAAAARPWPG